VVEELLPAFVSLVAEVNVDQWVAAWPYGFFDKHHSGLSGCTPAFSHVTACTGTDYVVPGGLAAHAAWDDVVE